MRVAQRVRTRRCWRQLTHTHTHTLTHLGFALNAFFAAQCGLVSLLFLLWRQVVALGSARQRVRTCRRLHLVVLHCAAARGRMFARRSDRWSIQLLMRHELGVCDMHGQAEGVVQCNGNK